MNVLLTGGAGYIGSVLLPLLLERDHEVTVLDSFLFGRGPIAPSLDRVRCIETDVRDVPRAALKGVEAIIHLGGLSNDPTADFNRRANFDINTRATADLARLAVKEGVSRFVFASTCSIYYTDEPADTVFTETSNVRPTASYSESKHRAELELMNLSNDICLTSLRKGTVFGLSPRMRFDLVVNTFTWYAHQKGRLVVHAGGRMWRPLVGVQDVARAYASIIEADEDAVSGEVFNLLHDNYKVIDVAHKVQRTLQEMGVEVDVEVQQVGIPRSYRVDGSKLRAAVQFNPIQTIESAVQDIWRYLEDRDSIFWNIVQLEKLIDEGTIDQETLRRVPR